MSIYILHYYLFLVPMQLYKPDHWTAGRRYRDIDTIKRWLRPMYRTYDNIADFR